MVRTMDLPVAPIWERYSGSKTGIAGVSAKEEDDAAFAEMVGRQAGLMYRVAYAVVRHAQEAEDVVQESFLKLYRSGRWRQMEEEKAFLAKAVWRNALDRLPKMAGWMEDVAEYEMAAGGDSPEQASLRGSERDLLRRMIDGLPEEMRQVLLLSAMEEMTSREVAKVAGLPEGTVRTRLMRAKAELKRRYIAAMEVRR